MTSTQLAQHVAQLLEDRKAQRVQILDIRKLSSVADFFVVCSGATPIQVRALADHVEEKLAEMGVRPHHTEGYRLGRWVLMDYGDVVVHILRNEERDFYSLERLWGDAPLLDHRVLAGAR
ncbi:ribosome silencing factor [Caldinitratiruptor microaerophilus]|uniref:Ribosomal silencing factor RsfS n=1 Tax=Caldinitratiruptor microaerophilus TaxID=671077 RepID=A0AA35GAM5_9FIRM|nr:ribosome silencing factor [Caldinitratiruptor microaerophilus]BDG61459.1 ribosomal silencing factor RsfS [Caldinitratiruptor microaerophilus]